VGDSNWTIVWLVLGASVVDDVLNGRNTLVIVDRGIGDIPWGVNYCS
jgi:hypothetical protein